ncbi:MAG: hypothetical protein LBL82_08945 [Oscillospiraceae bacterium]|jgi:Ger(x)C family germination protein|nr:hypothetical protein [Oscillospiraceae bacterium]
MLKRIRRAVAAILSFSLMFLCCGCWDMTDSMDRIIVVGIGVDTTTTEGLYDFTFQFLYPKASAWELNATSFKFVNTTVKARSLSLAQRELLKNFDASTTFEQLRTVVIGRDMSKENFEKVIEELFKENSTRKKSLAVVSDEKAKDLILNNDIEMDSCIRISEIITQYMVRGDGVLPSFNIQQLYIALENNLDFFLLNLSDYSTDNFSANGDVLSETDTSHDDEKALFITGLSYFKGGKLYGMLGNTELEIARLISGKQSDGYMSFDNYNNVICYAITKSNCRRYITFKDGLPYFHMYITLDCDIIDSQLKYETDTEFKKMEALIIQNLTDNINSLINYSQENSCPELLAFQSEMRQAHAKWFDDHPDYWANQYKDAAVECSIECTVNTFSYTA